MSATTFDLTDTLDSPSDAVRDEPIKLGPSLDHTGNCPECGATWRDKPIPEDSLRKGWYGEWDGVTPQYYSRIIGIELAYDHPRHYDGVSYWACPDCPAMWNRFDSNRLVDRSVLEVPA